MIERENEEDRDRKSEKIRTQSKEANPLTLHVLGAMPSHAFDFSFLGMVCPKSTI